MASNYKNVLYPSLVHFLKKLLPQMQKSYSSLLSVMDINSDPGLPILQRLQSTFMDRPLLLKLLKKHKPVDLKLQALLELLDAFKSQGISDADIQSCLEAVPTSWIDQISRNVSASSGPSVSAEKANDEELKKLYLEKTNNASLDILDEVLKMSETLG